MIELLVLNKDNGKIYEISEIVSSVSFSDSLNNGCSKLDFTYLYSGTVFANGSVVRFRYNDANIFYGYIFSYERGEGDEIDAVAYDQLRYLKAKDSFVVEGIRVDELIRVVAGMFNLRVGKLDDTAYKLPYKVVDNQTHLDTIYDGISATLLGTGRKYAFYDSYGSLTLTDLESMRLPLVIGDESLAYGYKYGQSIDNNTYNLIIIDKKTKDGDKRFPIIEKDDVSFGKYGILQYYEAAEDNANVEQLKEKARSLLWLLNAETRSLSLDVMGDTRVRAGNSILASISDLKIAQYLIISSCKHDFEANNHTMSLELVL
jgi:hypothetical protein